MTATFPIQLIGGRQDGESVEGMAALDIYDFVVAEGVREDYKRQSQEPPFVYVQVGYAVGEMPPRAINQPKDIT